jgi:hypothetical protein
MVMSKTTTVVVDGFAEVLVQRCRTELDPDLLVQRLGQCNQGDLLMKHHTDFSPELFKKNLAVGERPPHHIQLRRRSILTGRENPRTMTFHH